MALTFTDMRRYAEIHKEFGRMAEELEVLNAELKALDEKIIEAAEWESRYKFEVAEVGVFEVKGVQHFSVLDQDKDILITEWKKDEDLKAFVKEDINATTLKAELARQFVATGLTPKYARGFSNTVVKFKPVEKVKKLKKTREVKE